MDPFIWLAILAVLLVTEAITAGLTTIWFAGGALVAAVASYFGAGLITQLMLLLCVSLVLLIFTRPAAVKFMNKGVTKTNAESLIGRKAVVIQTIDNLAQTGQVRISDIEWMARTASDGIVIPENAVVMVKEIQGVKLIVEEVQEG
ncbi:NfeD family protein [Blautia sp. HCP3S3_G3]|uniref:NfeD family protein n=1 Tax=Blautia sp. HCP3S3_G3 TaxID=3438913 RepID=UPI003F8B8AEB